MARLNSVSGFFNYKVINGFRSKSSLMSDRALLDSCIQIKEIRINRSTSIPSQINFRLNIATLERLERIKSNNQQLRLSASIIADLRCYVLHNAFVELLITKPQYKVSSPRSRSPLIFSTHYASTSQRSTILLQSAIDLKGQISQQIQRDLYQNPQMLTRISLVHYWLISELLAQLPLKNNKYSWLVFSCSFLIVTLVGLISWYLFPFNKFLNLIIICSVFLILNTSLKKTLVQVITTWLIYHLVEGFLAKNAVKRQIGWKIFSLLL